MADQASPAPAPGGPGHRTGYRAARRAFEAGRYLDAIPGLRREIAAAPDDVEARVLLGACLAEVGETGAAEGMLRSASALDPVHVGARLRLGDLLVDLGRAAEALGEFRAVLTIDPDHPGALTRVIELS